MLTHAPAFVPAVVTDVDQHLRPAAHHLTRDPGKNTVVTDVGAVHRAVQFQGPGGLPDGRRLEPESQQGEHPDPQWPQRPLLEGKILAHRHGLELVVHDRTLAVAIPAHRAVVRVPVYAVDARRWHAVQVGLVLDGRLAPDHEFPRLPGPRQLCQPLNLRPRRQLATGPPERVELAADQQGAALWPLGAASGAAVSPAARPQQQRRQRGRITPQRQAHQAGRREGHQQAQPAYAQQISRLGHRRGQQRVAQV